MLKKKYKLEIKFNGNVRAYFVIFKRKYFWQRWKEVHSELVYDGNCSHHAQENINQHVIKQRGEKIKLRYWKDERGETPIEPYW